MEKKTLRDIRDYLNTLTEEQLDQEPIMLANPDEGNKGGRVGVDALGEDYYYHEDGCFPKSCLSEEDFLDYMENEEGRIQWTADKVFFFIDDSTNN